MWFLASTRHLTVHRLIMQHVKPAGHPFTKPYKTSYHVSPSIEATRHGFRLGGSLWNLTGLGSNAAEPPVKFQGDKMTWTQILAVSRLSEITTNVLRRWTWNLRLWLPLVSQWLFYWVIGWYGCSPQWPFNNIVRKCRFAQFIPPSAWTLKHYCPFNDGFVAKICF